MMDARIPRKTPLGVDEIKTRSRGLPARLRTLLLLVDGERSVQVLNQMVHLTEGAAPALTTLVEQGLVEIPDAAQPAPPKAKVKKPQQPLEDTAAPTTVIPAVIPDAAPEFSDSKMRLAAIAAAALKANPETRRKAPEPRPAAAPATAAAPAIVEAGKEGAQGIARNAQETAVEKTAEATEKTVEKTTAKAAGKAPESASRASEPAAAAIATPVTAPTIQAAPKHSVPQKSSRHPPTPAPAPQPAVDPIETAFLVARAHLASILDENLGVEGYALRQKVTNSTSVRELISHFDAIEESLIGSLGIAGATNVILRTLAILQTP